MDLDIGAVAGLEPGLGRELIPAWLRDYVEGDPAVCEAFVRAVHRALDETSDEALSRLFHAFASTGADWQLYPADPAARHLSRTAMATLVPRYEVLGLERLREAVSAGPCLLLSNHLSYVDTQVTDLLLHLCGAADLADQIVAVAGPKVYSTPFRRMAAISLSTLKTAQSTALTHNEASLTPREVGRIALETVHRSAELQAQGHPILIYAEGSRSRTGRLQPFLRAVSRYAGQPGVQVIPVAISGTDVLYPLDAKTMRPADVRLAFGEPILGLGRLEALEACWRAVAALLPEAHRPDPETAPIL